MQLCWKISMTSVSTMTVLNPIIRRYSTYLTGGIRILYRVAFTKESSRLLIRRIGKMNNTEFLEKCRSSQPITCEDLGIPEWRRDTTGVVYLRSGHIFYKSPDGYRDTNGKILTPWQRILYGLGRI